MRKNVVNIFSLLMFVGAISFATSCKKDGNGANGGATTVIIGCMDTDGYNYNADATESSENCSFMKASMYEVTYHAEFGENGNDWDQNLINKKADIIFRIKEQGTSDWMFESDVINNHVHTDTTQWQAPNPEILKNKMYEWELVDDETTGSHSVMANGTFNPRDLANDDNEIVSTYTDVNGLATQIKVYYFIQ